MGRRSTGFVATSRGQSRNLVISLASSGVFHSMEKVFRKWASGHAWPLSRSGTCPAGNPCAGRARSTLGKKCFYGVKNFPGRSFRISSARWVWGLTDVAVPHAGYFACRILAHSLVNAAGNQVCISARRALDPNDHGLRPFHHPVPFHH